MFSIVHFLSDGWSRYLARLDWRRDFMYRLINTNFDKITVIVLIHITDWLVNYLSNYLLCKKKDLNKRLNFSCSINPVIC
jgi:hypothetical protein